MRTEWEKSVMSESDFEAISANGVGSADELADMAISCMDCSSEFTWTKGEQIFFHDKRLLNPPKRCKQCKKEKNHRLETIHQNRVSGKKQRIDVRAQCAKCSTVTTVPFYPSQGRPVYCRTCFQEMKALSTNGNHG
jgi:CxxC-x17-CxxC domain-containing protein